MIFLMKASKDHSRMKKTILIISITSDIGTAIAEFYKAKNYNLVGTFNTKSKNYLKLQSIGVTLYKCNLESSKSIENFKLKIGKKFKWDISIFAAGTQNPIGKFQNNNFNDWDTGIKINFINQIRVLHFILPFRNNSRKNNPRVLFFAGGGTNNATTNYSSYTISKIASIKMMELLDAEIKDTIFSILGPGWVKTKIHNETLLDRKNSESNYDKTKKMLDSNLCFPMNNLIKCIDWLLNEKKEIVGGRNFSAVFDPWDKKTIKSLSKDSNLFKLRRYGNEKYNS